MALSFLHLCYHIHWCYNFSQLPISVWTSRLLTFFTPCISNTLFIANCLRSVLAKRYHKCIYDCWNSLAYRCAQKPPGRRQKQTRLSTKVSSLLLEAVSHVYMDDITIEIARSREPWRKLSPRIRCWGSKRYRQRIRRRCKKPQLRKINSASSILYMKTRKWTIFPYHSRVFTGLKNRTKKHLQKR